MRRVTNWIEKYMEFRKQSEAPDDFLRWSALWSLSAVVGRKAWLKFASYTVYPNMWVVLVGPPGTFKSTVCDMATEMFEDIKTVHTGPDMTSIQALIKGLPLTTAEFDFNGVTYNHQSMAITVPEWTSLTGEKDMETCTILCRLYDSDARHFNKWTTTQGCDYLKNFCVTKLAGSAPELITARLPSSAIGAGLSSRIVFIVCDADMEKQDPLGEMSIESYTLGEYLKETLEHIHTDVVGPYLIHEDGKKWFLKWYDTNKRGQNRIILDRKFEYYYNRKPQFILKMGMLLAISEGDTRIVQRDHLEDALKMLNKAELRMPEVFSGFGTNPVAPQMEMILQEFKKRKVEVLTLKDLGAALWRDMSSTQLKEAIKTMARYGFIVLGEDNKTIRVAK